MRELDKAVIEATNNKEKLDLLILQQEPFIKKCASARMHKFISTSDDEWSIALSAFVEAVKEYDLSKGSFISFSKLVIERRLIDYLRNQDKYKNEVSVDPIVFNSDSTDEEEALSLRLEVARKVAVEQDDSIPLEIEAINGVFSGYGFGFMDLADCSPHAGKTKKVCAKAVIFMMKNPLLFKEMQNTKQLPLKIIEKNAKLPRKIVERHRKYIIAAIEILSGEYPKLAEYLRYIREEESL